MATNLVLTFSDETAKTPFRFTMTGINVYSLEEARYHCQHYWRESQEDFLSDEFVEWLGGIGLSYFAPKIRSLRESSNFSDKLLGFLRLAQADNGEIKKLASQIEAWERRQQWERFKEQGDFSMNQGEHERAFAYYQKALTSIKNAGLLNNSAMALIKLGDYHKAVDMLKDAERLADRDLKTEISLNLAEAQILAGQYDLAQEHISRLNETLGQTGPVLYLEAELDLAKLRYQSAVTKLESAITLEENPHYIYRLAHVYEKQRLFEKALDSLNRIRVKDVFFLKRQAEIYAASDNIPAAIRAIQKALVSAPSNVDLWVRLAMYHRMDYDLNRADSAIIKARSLSKDHPEVNLESARIKKAQGRVKEYQTILNAVINTVKAQYLDNISV